MTTFSKFRSAASLYRVEHRVRLARAVLESFCDRHGVSVSQLLANDRRRSISHLRQDAYAHVKAATRFGDWLLARAFDRDPKTVRHGRQRSLARRST